MRRTRATTRRCVIALGVVTLPRDRVHHHDESPGPTTTDGDHASSGAGPTTIRPRPRPPASSPRCPPDATAAYPRRATCSRSSPRAAAWAIAPEEPTSLRCLFPVSERGPVVVGSGWRPRRARRPASPRRRDLAVTSGGQPLAVVLLVEPADGHDRRVHRPVPEGPAPRRPGLRRDTGHHARPRRDVRRHRLPPVGPGHRLRRHATRRPAGDLDLHQHRAASPQPLVTAQDPGTTFGHIVFAHDGTGLYYSVDRPGGSTPWPASSCPRGNVEIACGRATAPSTTSPSSLACRAWP